MNIFGCTLNNWVLDEITTDGVNISIVDNSNYTGYSDIAQAGGATSITLASSESAWNDFFNNAEIAIIAGTGSGQTNIITDYVGSTKVATVQNAWGTQPDDTSVYVIGEVGHLKSYFTDFRQIFITNPTGTTTLLDAISKPYNSTLPITDTYTIPDGDGVYNVILTSVPTYSAGVEYKEITKPCVYYGGILYKCLADTLAETPDVSPTKWEALTDWTLLPLKYKYEANIAVYCSILSCYLSSVFVASTKNECMGCNSEMFMRDPYVQKSLKLSMVISSIPKLAIYGEWDRIQQSINFAKNICCGCN